MTKRKQPTSIRTITKETFEDKVELVELIYAIVGNREKVLRALGTCSETYNNHYDRLGVKPPTLDQCKDKLAITSLKNLIRMSGGEDKVAMDINIGLIKQSRPEYIGYDKNLIDHDSK